MKAVYALVTVAALAAPVAATQGEIIEQVLVKVNGDIITKTDLEARQIAALRERGLAPSRQTATGLRSENCPFQYG